MKRTALVVTIVFALLAFGCGFAGTTAALDVSRPAVSGSSATVQFVVGEGDTSTEIATKLEKAGLIRNAMIFRLFARYKHLDSGLRKGTYNLSPGMTMDQIIATLLSTPINEQIVALVPPGQRVTQYPKFFSKLPKFDADNFAKIAQTGKLLDSAQTPLWTKYWFVQRPSSQVRYALEGYLFPDTYSFDKNADETKVVETMLENFGAHLCPGPDNNPNAYIDTLADCKSHAAKVGNTDIFSGLEKAYGTKNDVAALHTALTLAALTSREIANLSDAPGVTNVYYTRYMAILGKTNNTGATWSLGSDPSAQYALDNKTPPKDGHWWKELPDAGANVATTDPYNTDVVTTPPTALPPGPIAAPVWAEIAAAANPSVSQYFYFVSNCSGKILYATTLEQNNANNPAHCP
jgi:UPF0755 protein